MRAQALHYERDNNKIIRITLSRHLCNSTAFDPTLGFIGKINKVNVFFVPMMLQFNCLPQSNGDSFIPIAAAINTFGKGIGLTHRKFEFI